MSIRIARLLSTSLVVLLAGCPSKQQDQQTQTQAASAPASVPASAPASAPAVASVAAPASVPLPASAPESQAQQFPPEELEALVAPIALYPDSLLSQILMASTYPLEIVHAARWVKTHKNLKGDAAVQAVQDQPWDVSVKSLVAFPQVLEPMNDKLDWTQRLGDAFLANEKDVLDAVQRLRMRAQKAGHLASNEQQKVIVEAPAAPGAGGQAAPAQQTIVRIEPSNPQVVYVPAYNPTVVYGGWSAPAYPPTYWPPYPAYYPGAALASGFAWGLGIAAAGAIFSNCNWGGGDVNINVNKAANIDRNFDRTKVEGGKWKHDAGHRQGVAYRDNATRNKYANGVQGADARRDYRGRTGGATERAGVANRAEGTNRTGRQNNVSTADRAGRSAGAGNRSDKTARSATAGNRAQTANRTAGAGANHRAQTANRDAAAGNRAQTSNRSAAASNRAQTPTRVGSSNAQTGFGGAGGGGGRDSAFQGVGGGAGATQRDFNRGQASAQSSNFNRGGGAARGGGGGGRGGRR
ncbi:MULTISPECIES: DUF3300 domain-containing protein [Paraburkholderia]|nr:MULTISPECIES: DUF3300 domain-containing protein [Paraburkholderia]BEU24748.1 DUF3300 domain-containing protein [Paraburkholderia sp. 22B1P]GJH32914.1 DUF3300 domain-containing protein [Paraburkholderia hospita]